METKILNIIKFICLIILVAYGFFNDWCLNNLGGIPFIFAAFYMVIPRRVFKWALKEENETNSLGEN